MKFDKRFLYIGICIHVVYFTISLLLFFFTTYSETSDFLTYYNAGKIILENINYLYDQTYYNFPYRYFPISAYFFAPFALLSYELGYLLFQICSLVVNLLNCYLIVVIVNKIQNKNDIVVSKDIILKFIVIYLAVFPHFMNYALGQVNNLITLLILLALFLFMNNSVVSDLCGGLLIGFSISIKPLAIFIIPFVLISYYKMKKIDFKLLISRLVGIIIPLLISLLYFIVFPALWQGFLDINLSGEYTEEGINNSISVTRAILNLFYVLNAPANNIFVFFIVSLGIAVPGFLIYLFRRNSLIGMNEAIIFGMIIMLLVYFDSWDHHLVSLAPFLSIFLIVNDNSSDLKQEKSINTFKLGYYLLATLVVPMSGVFFLTYNYFPFNLWGSIFLLVIFIGLIRFTFLTSEHEE